MTMLMLSTNRYGLLEAPLRDLPINTLFARAVVEGHVPGRVYVDDHESPQAYYVAHPYGMSLLFGSTAREGFRQALGRYLTGEGLSREAPEWLQVYPNAWSEVVRDLLGKRLIGTDSGKSTEADGLIVEDTRVNFHFDPWRYSRATEEAELPAGCSFVDDVEWIYTQMRGSVVPSVFWASADALRERGAAIALLYRGQLASVAFASFAMDGMLELGIETVERFRGRGLAFHSCRALIDRCLAQNLEPVWACRLGNIGSYRLAIKLGFDHARSLPYYKLPPSPAEVASLTAATLSATA